MMTKREGRVADKIIIVTGAAQGMGAAEALALAQEGATVIAVDLLEFEPEHPGIVPRTMDVSREADWLALADWLGRQYGRIDGLVNNAAITHRKRLGEISLSEWNRVFAINATGPFLAMQVLMPLMVEGTSIVNIASIASATGHFPAAYTASKWALRGLSRSATLELGELGVRVNTVLPGAIETPMTGAISNKVEAALLKEIPLGRRGKPGDLAGIILFLQSDESAFISGAEIPVDGGQLGQGGMKGLSDAVREASQS